MSVLEAPAPAVTPPARRRLMGKAYDLAGATDATEARRLAGLDWEAIHRPLYVDLPPAEGDEVGDVVLVDRERAVVRDDTREMFGVVGREHKILSNAEMFDFADTLLSEADTTWADSSPFGGALAGGKKPFLVFQLGEGVQVGGVDAVGQAVMLSNGHVGNTAFTVNVLPVRLRCSNVVTAAIARGRKGANMFSYTVQHSGDLADKVAQAHAALDMTSAYMREFAAIADRLADIDFDASMFDDLLVDLVPLADDAGDKAVKTALATRGAFRTNWRETLTLTPELKHTAWGALNVITEVIDHGNLDVRKSKVDPAERRMNSVHFGAGARMRDRAYSLLGV